MNVCHVTRDRVVIPVLPRPVYAGPLTDLSALPRDIEKRIVVLQPREMNGITRMVAYDQESDTLFIKVSDDG